MRCLCLLAASLFLCSACSFYDKELTALHGASIDEAVMELGEPTKKEKGVYIWLTDRMEQGGGYYTTHYETAYTYDKNGKVISTTEVPFREWVEPYETRKWCKTVVRFTHDGSIYAHEYDGNDCPW